MPKRKRQDLSKPSVTAGPLDEGTGQRSAFPQVVSLSFGRDTEWHYDSEGGEDDTGEYEDGELLDEADSFVGFDGYDEMTKDVYEDEPPEQAEEEVAPEPVDDDEWEVEPQTEAIAYLQSVRAEAENLPSIAYVETPRAPKQSGTNVRNEAERPAEPASSTKSDDVWRDQFLEYYRNLRETFANAPEPNLSQNELDDLFRLDVNNRPETSDQEDRIWRLKTFDSPSITLLSMLDHRRIMHLLIHLRKKLSRNMKTEQCMWLVFLLAKLEDPGVLNGEEVDLLRRIARKARTVREGMDGKGEEVVLSTIDMAICIIKHYYQQRDLEDSIESEA